MFETVFLTSLQAFYLRIRREHATRDSTPITTRQLESLARLAQARARLELRSVASKSDAEEVGHLSVARCVSHLLQVVELAEECMFSAWEDQFGAFDVRRATGMSKAKTKTLFMGELTRRHERSGEKVYGMEQLKGVAKELGILGQIDDFYAFVDEINLAGFFTRTAKNSYQLTGRLH